MESSGDVKVKEEDDVTVGEFAENQNDDWLDVDDGMSSPSIDDSELVQLPSKYTYPVGCPVWYNIFQSASNSDRTIDLEFCTGVIASVLMDDARNLVYKVESKHNIIDTNEDLPNGSVDTVREHCIAFASDCSVRVRMDQEDIDGKVVRANPVFNANGKIEAINYTITVQLEGNKCKILHDVPAENIRYRHPITKVEKRKLANNAGIMVVDCSLGKRKRPKLDNGSNEQAGSNQVPQINRWMNPTISYAIAKPRAIKISASYKMRSPPDGSPVQAAPIGSSLHHHGGASASLSSKLNSAPLSPMSNSVTTQSHEQRQQHNNTIPVSSIVLSTYSQRKVASSIASFVSEPKADTDALKNSLSEKVGDGLTLEPEGLKNDETAEAAIRVNAMLRSGLSSTSGSLFNTATNNQEIPDSSASFLGKRSLDESSSIIVTQSEAVNAVGSGTNRHTHPTKAAHSLAEPCPVPTRHQIDITASWQPTDEKSIAITPTKAKNDRKEVSVRKNWSSGERLSILAEAAKNENNKRSKSKAQWLKDQGIPRAVFNRYKKNELVGQGRPCKCNQLVSQQYDSITEGHLDAYDHINEMMGIWQREDDNGYAKDKRKKRELFVCIPNFNNFTNWVRMPETEEKLAKYTNIHFIAHIGRHYCYMLAKKWADVKYYDSAKYESSTSGGRSGSEERMKVVIRRICNICPTFFGKQDPTNECKISCVIKNIARQRNDVDCGVFALFFADCIRNNFTIKPDLSDQEIRNYRGFLHETLDK